MGASLALFYALRFPEHVSAVVYLNGTGLGRSWKSAYDARLERLSPADRARFIELQSRNDLSEEEEREQVLFQVLCDLGGASRRVEVAERMLDSRFRMSVDVNAALGADVKALAEEELVARCQSLDVPVLVVAGDEDPRPPSAVDSLVAALPQAELVVTRGVGHLSWLEDPDGLRAILRPFISRAATA